MLWGCNKKRRSLALTSYYDLGLNKVGEHSEEKSKDWTTSNIYLISLWLRITKCSLWGNGLAMLTQLTLSKIKILPALEHVTRIVLWQVTFITSSLVFLLTPYTREIDMNCQKTCPSILKSFLIYWFKRKSGERETLIGCSAYCSLHMLWLGI